MRRALCGALLLPLAFAAQAVADPHWVRVTTPNATGPGYAYRAAAAFGERGVWAVGDASSTVAREQQFRTLVSRWNGHGWWRVPTPDRETTPQDDHLLDVSAPGPARAWAVGSSAAGLGDTAPRPLVLRWDGASWRLVNGPFGFAGRLTAVAAARNGTLWVGGDERVDPPRFDQSPRVFRRVDDGWRKVKLTPIPGCKASDDHEVIRAEVTDIASRGLRATWVTGDCEAFAGRRGFLLRYDGTRWITVLSPDTLAPYGGNSRLTSVSMAPDGEVWAVGSGDGFGHGVKPIAYRGSGGLVHPVPALVQGEGAALSAVAAESGGAAVAAGDFGEPLAHLLGSTGASDGGLALEPVVSTTGGFVNGVALSPDGTAWAVGHSSGNSTGNGLIYKRTP